MSDERDDPHGDRAWLEARRQRGRGALLDAEAFDDGEADFEDTGRRDEEDPEGHAGEGERPPPASDQVMIPRIVKGGHVRWVRISLPPECPITPLGVTGRTSWYLSGIHQLIGLQDSEHGQAHIRALWAPHIDELQRAFPQFDQSNRFKGFQAQYAADAMVAACAVKGPFDAHEKVRGLGCWKDDDGQLVQHLGDRVLVAGAEHRPGELGGYVYPARPAITAPRRGGKADCEKIYAHFQCWNYERGEVDARLLLGQVAAGILGAAIDWRPMAFLTGDAGTGKSTLQRRIRALHPKRIVGTVDASEAALRALLGHDALTVSFDEIEADAHSDRAQAVMKLARTSASGDDAHRSGSDQQARSFTLRGSFLFSAIVPPSMRQQDMQRFAFLRLKTLKKGQRLPPLTTAELGALGAGMVGRITEGWPRWERTLDLFFQALQERRHEHRGAMQFGTCLAAAHILLEDGDPTAEDLERWCDPLHRDELFEYENSAPTWLTIWRHILSSLPEAWRGHGSPSVAEVVKKWLVAHAAGDGGKDERRKLQGWLNQVGLHLVVERGTRRIYLAVAPKHQGLASMFRGSDYQAAGGEGAWNIPLRGAPKIEEDGVLRVEKVPNLGRLKCPMFWLDGTVEVAGQREPIFDRDGDDQEIEPSLEGRAEAFMAAIGRAPDHKTLRKLYDKAADLRAELAAAQPQLADKADEAFNARWIELESPPAPEPEAGG
jgi:hypothetical protein